MMHKQDLYLITGRNRFFGQTRKPWVSMETSVLADSLEQLGFRLTETTFSELLNRDMPIHKKPIFYTFSQKENRRQCISDLVHYMEDQDNILVPSYELLRCHENKGYQELHKKKLGIAGPRAYYICHPQEVKDYPIRFPVVLKTLDGSNGKGVFLARNNSDLHKIIRGLSKTRWSLKADLLRRKYLRGQKKYPHYPHYSNRQDYEQYRDYILPETNFVLQEFIPDLQYDYRILILYDKFYIMRRLTPKNDFRASGAKIHRFDFEPDAELLNYSKQVFEKFDTPFLSIDVCEKDKNYYLLEYQALHFGINVIVKGKGYYMQSNQTWHFFEHNNSFEFEMALALSKYLKERI